MSRHPEDSRLSPPEIDAAESHSTDEERTPLQEQGALQPFIVAILTTALLMGPIVVIRLVGPNPAWRWLPISVFLIALEAVYTSQWLAHPQRRHFNRTRYRLAELAVIALALRLLTWALSGGLPGWEVWRSYLLSPLSFFDGLYFGYLLCAFFGWERAVTFHSQLRAISISRAEEQFYTLSTEEQGQRTYDRPVDRERPRIFAALAGSWLGGGMLLAFCAALSTVELTSISVSAGLRNVTRLGLNSTLLLALIVYFILGLWVISQARLEMMRARWLADGVTANENVVNNWRRASITLLLVVAVFAAFLPIGSTFAAAAVLQAIFGAALLVSQLALLLLNTIIALFISLFAISTPLEEGEELLPIPTPAPPPEAPATPLDETTALLAGGVFWILVAAMVVVALLFFLRDRGISLRYEPILRLAALFRQWIASLRTGLVRRTAGARQVLRRRLEALRPSRPGASPPWRFLRVNALPPREQVRYFYLSTVRRAADEGLPRDKSETPSEYARDLQEQWPEAEAEIEALTEAFLEARYSSREFDTQDVNPVKQVWKRVRRAIRRNFSP